MGNPILFGGEVRLRSAFWAAGVVASIALPAAFAGADRASAGPVNVPAPPKVNVPTVNVPKVNVLKVTVPTVNVPKVTAPTVNVPKVTVPTASVPKVTVPAASISAKVPLTGPQLPPSRIKLNIKPGGVPAIGAPSKFGGVPGKPKTGTPVYGPGGVDPCAGGCASSTTSDGAKGAPSNFGAVPPTGAQVPSSGVPPTGAAPSSSGAGVALSAKGGAAGSATGDAPGVAPSAKGGAAGVARPASYKNNTACGRYPYPPCR
jgi:hypothetical protein